MPKQVPVISPLDAAKLFLDAQELWAPRRRATNARTVLAMIERLGFVQLDSIQTLARAQDLILHARLEGYTPEHLDRLRARRQVFEGWTHDASLVPACQHPYWRERFLRDDPKIRAHRWWQNLLGDRVEATCAEVLSRIQAEGPLRSADFAHPEARGPWWGWKPQKAALDYLWRTGRLAVVQRRGFQKIYDLPERALAEALALPTPDPADRIEWLAWQAAQRLVCFTPRELAAFWGDLDLSEARTWCQTALATGRLATVALPGADGSPNQAALALADWETRLQRLREPEPGLRLLAPFDPVLRDRARALHRFGFDYRFEAFVPEPKRQYGYYVLPLLEGAHLVGRLDAHYERAQRRLRGRKVWWEPHQQPRPQALREALYRLGAFLGALDVTLPPPAKG